MAIRPFTRRWAAAAGAAALVWGSGSLPAHAESARSAEDAQVRLALDAPRMYALYNADEGADALDDGLLVRVSRKGAAPARNVRLTVDARSLTGLVGRISGRHCHGGDTPGVFTCTYGSELKWNTKKNPFAVRGKDGVRPGESGTVRYTLTADNAPTVHGSTRVRIAGPGVVQSERLKVSDVRPGSSFRFTPAFANPTGLRSDKGFALVLRGYGDAPALAREHSNCFYAKKDPAAAWCEFPGRIEPHTGYRTSVPLTAKADRDMASQNLSYEISYQERTSWTAFEQEGVEFTERGHGAPLTLEHTDEDKLPAPHDARTEVRVRTTSHVDYAAVGGTVRGKAGDTVELPLGVLDKGPGQIPGDGREGRYEVTVPEGTTVTSIPYEIDGDRVDWGCDRPKKSGGDERTFVCHLGGAQFGPLAPGERALNTFRIRIDRAVPGARGSVRAFGAYDRTPGNDKAPLAVEVEGAPRDGGVSWALPTGVAAVVVLAGLAGYVLVRRRRRA
ncbi:hypothetical protein [Streptomyces sp. NPDC007088]|uniref:hypothetical protein n=1 Tax=Streptomyces sp. NPDC007088 TaxID=3364773 RepID=UPI003693CEE4